MTEVKIDLKNLNSYLSNNKITLTSENMEEINSIFTMCDQQNEQGENVADGKLTGDEVPNFQKMIMQKLPNIFNHVRDFIDKIANEDNKILSGNQQMPQIQEVKCHRTKEEQEIYIQKFEEAKSILLNNAEVLNLTRQEIEYINNIDFESITNGPARYDRNKDRVTFNINDANPPEVGGFVKIIMHEVTHGVLKDTDYTQKQELICEQKGITIAKKLYDNMNEKDKEQFNFHIYGNLLLNDLKTDSDIENYLSNWIKNYNYLPEN